MSVKPRLTNRFLVRLTDAEATRTVRVGAKAATLAHLCRCGFDVPDGLVLDTSAFRLIIERCEAPSRETIPSVPLPAVVEEAVIQAGAILGDCELAVRSSATDEDSAGSSFAGQYESVLGVRGPAQLVAAVRTCWASMFGVSVDVYRRGSPGGEAMGVLVQRQVDADAAGIAFSADPVTGERDMVVINAVGGLGDRLAGGDVTGERWRVSSSGPAAESDMVVLRADQADEIARLARAVASVFRAPQDIEWAIESGKLWLLQARPITSLPEPPFKPVPVTVTVPEGFWERDASHWPAPNSPLARSITYPLANAGTAQMCAEYGMLADRIELADIGGWHYTRTVPLGGADKRSPPALVLGIVARIHPAMRRRVKTAIEVARSQKARQVIARWWDEWQPALVTRARQLLERDLTGLGDDALLTHYGDAVDLLAAGMKSHVFVLGALMIETYPLLKLCRDLFGWDEIRTLGLVTGLSTWSSQPARELAKLAGLASGMPGLIALLENVTAKTHQLLGEKDVEFFNAFERYRWTYATGMLTRDFADSTLADRPELLLRMLSHQVATGFEPGTVDQVNETQRVDLLQEAHTLLAGRTGGDRGEFDDALVRAERAYPVREDNVFVALQTPGGLIRYAALELGRRMAGRGDLDRTEDVFFLEDKELRHGFTDHVDCHGVVTRRRGERAWALAHPGPLSYGTPPGRPPSMRFLPAEVRDATEAFYWMTARVIDSGAAQSSTGAINGVAASPGSYTGTVRVVMGEHEFDKIRPGDVCVCPVTQPTWSVLFPSLGAIVTDSGGVLSHSAIIAREYRIPAVVATGNATELLADGQLVTVDGSAGIVTLAKS